MFVLSHLGLPAREPEGGARVMASLSRGGHPTTRGDAGDACEPAAVPARDDETAVVEGERLARPVGQLSLQVTGHGPALFEAHLRQRGQRVPGVWVYHRREGRRRSGASLRAPRTPRLIKTAPSLFGR